MKMLFPPVMIAGFLLLFFAPDNGWAQAGKDTHSQDVLSISSDIFLPNAFSPNGDGLNDLFFPVIIKKNFYKVYSFKIFNKLGREVYSTENSISGWNGTVNGNPAPSATYAYCVQLFGDDGQQKIVKGNVTLLR